MTGRFTFPATFIFSTFVVLASIAGIIILWVPISDFPAEYSVQENPSLLYVYDESTSTAICEATYGGSYYVKWGCYDRSPLSSTSSLLDFYLKSYYGIEEEYTVLLSYRATLTSSTPRATVTVTATPSAYLQSLSQSAVQSTIATKSAQAGFVTITPIPSEYKVTRLAKRLEYDDDIPETLKGNIVSTMTPPPSSTMFQVHLPRPKVSFF